MRVTGVLFLGCVLVLTAHAAPRDPVQDLKDNVDHIIIFMQENRAFDHYFGMLQGVRGFNDRVSVPMANGMPSAFYQSVKGSDYILPFPLNTTETNAECMPAPEMDYECDIKMWNGGRVDRWNAARDPGYGMSYWTRETLPYYYTLYDNFVAGDQYFQSTFTCTNPNRLHLFTGSNGLSVGHDAMLDNTEPNPGFDWITMGEIMQNNNISWKLYQELDNFDDNAFAWFETYMTAKPGNPLYDKGMYHSVDLIAEFDKDLAAGTLPQVVWIVGPTDKSEHATNHPSAGEDFTARILLTLKKYPDTYKKSVFILNYDEGGQFFDHHYVPTPPLGGPDAGISTAPVAGEVNDKVMTSVPAPIGLGFRVPLLIISPFTRGNIVVSQTFDHTSVVQLLEKRFDVKCPNISPWRRLVTGDLLSVFNFTSPDYSWPALPDTSDYVRKADVECDTKPPPTLPTKQSMPTQEKGVRISKALPYEFSANGVVVGSTMRLIIQNTGMAGAWFTLFDEVLYTTRLPRQYAVGAGLFVEDDFDISGEASNNSIYALSLYGPNGFVRQFGGNLTYSGVAASLQYAPSTSQVTVVLANNRPSTQPVTFSIVDNAYGSLPKPLNVSVPGGSTIIQRSIDTSGSGNWYDISVTVTDASTQSIVYLRRFMGHMENGKDSISDPAMSAGKPVASTTLQGLKGIAARPNPETHPDTPEYVRLIKVAKPTHKDVLAGRFEL